MPNTPRLPGRTTSTSTSSRSSRIAANPAATAASTLFPRNSPLFSPVIRLHPQRHCRRAYRRRRFFRLTGFSGVSSVARLATWAPSLPLAAPALTVLPPPFVLLRVVVTPALWAVALGFDVPLIVAPASAGCPACKKGNQSARAPQPVTKYCCTTPNKFETVQYSVKPRRQAKGNPAKHDGHEDHHLAHHVRLRILRGAGSLARLRHLLNQQLR